MSAKTNHFKVGMFALAGLAIMLAGLFAFGARSYFERRTIYETYVVDDVEGLSVGSPVKLRGVPMGKVTKINFSWNEYPGSHSNYVVVQFEVLESVSPIPRERDQAELLQAEIAKGLRARVSLQGITGVSIVMLDYVDPDRNPPAPFDWKPRHLYVPSARGQFSQILTSIENSLRNFEKLDFGRLSESVDKSLSALARLSMKLEGFDLPTLGTNVNLLVGELRDTTTKLQSFLAEANRTIQGMHLEALTQDASSLLKDTSSLLAQLRTIAGDVQRTLDGLDTTPLNETMVNARQATESMNEVLRDLKEHPAGFLFGKAPPPAKSVAPRSKP